MRMYNGQEPDWIPFGEEERAARLSIRASGLPKERGTTYRSSPNKIRAWMSNPCPAKTITI
jgi:hypothetical protein